MPDFQSFDQKSLLTRHSLLLRREKKKEKKKRKEKKRREEKKKNFPVSEFSSTIPALPDVRQEGIACTFLHMAGTNTADYSSIMV